MPKRTTGLGDGSRIPLRGLTSLFKQLDPSAQNILKSAFVDAEDLTNFHNRSVPERQSRRKITGRVQTINLTAESNLLGAFLSWNRVDDKRISQYELQVSDNSVFSDPESFSLLENFFVLENLRFVRFARVRAVTFAGDCGLFSNVVTLRPKISAPQAYSINFYQNYGDDSDPATGRKFLYSGGDINNDVHPAFYTVLSDTFYHDRQLGGVSIWGYLTSRLHKFRDGGTVPWDRVRFKVNGIARTDAYIPFWTLNYDEDNFHGNERDPSGSLMTFYSKAGYTASFGPYAVTLPNSIAGEGPNDPHNVYDRQAADGSFYWEDALNAARASRFDEGQLNDLDDDSPHHEANSFGITENSKTDWLIFRDFRFSIPSNQTIVGIEAKVKRRQNNEFKDPIPLDKGNATVNAPFTTQTGLVNSDIAEDVSFGRFLRFTAATDLLDTVNLLPGLTQGGGFTLALWLNNSKLTLGATATDRESIFTMFSDNGAALATGNFFRVRREPGSTSHRLRVDFKRAGDLTELFLIDDFFDTANTWIHLGIRWNGTNQLAIFKNGVLFDTGTTAGGTFITSDLFEFQLGDTSGLSDRAFEGGMSQVALFDKALTDAELEDIARNPGNFKIDLRKNFGDYESANKLVHYWLFLPDQADIRDSKVVLVDETDTIRTDLDNKAETDESWPRLSTFFYTDIRQFGILPLGLSDGVPHDNHTAIGYQTYGGEDDLWGRVWTPSQINNFYFGLAFQAENIPLNGFSGKAYVDHAKITIYTEPAVDRNVNVELQVAAASEFYLQREVFGAIINLIEIGERLVELTE